MAIILNHIDNPRNIKIRSQGQMIDAVRVYVNGTPDWGKPFSIMLNVGEHTTVTATRTSSPNQHANIEVLSSGATVYYGDEITITMSADSGYELTTSTITVGGESATSPITVSGEVVITTTAQQTAIIAPVLQFYGASDTSAYLGYRLTNNNPYTVTYHLTVTQNGSTVATRTSTLQANYSMPTANYISNGISFDKVYVCSVYFVGNGQTSETVSASGIPRYET